MEHKRFLCLLANAGSQCGLGMGKGHLRRLAGWRSSKVLPKASTRYRQRLSSNLMMRKNSHILAADIFPVVKARTKA